MSDGRRIETVKQEESTYSWLTNIIHASSNLALDIKSTQFAVKRRPKHTRCRARLIRWYVRRLKTWFTWCWWRARWWDSRDKRRFWRVDWTKGRRRPHSRQHWRYPWWLIRWNHRRLTWWRYWRLIRRNHRWSIWRRSRRLIRRNERRVIWWCPRRFIWRYHWWLIRWNHRRLTWWRYWR